jgi:hypothetical protein
LKYGEKIYAESLFSALDLFVADISC